MPEMSIEAVKVITNEVSGLSGEEVTLNGEILITGQVTISEQGFCWNNSGNPTIADRKTIVPGQLGVIQTSLSSLSKATTYYTKAYAINSEGIVKYGDEVTFTTLDKYQILSTTRFIYKYAYHNPQSNILYFLLGDGDGLVVPTNLISYNYELDSVLATRNIGNYNFSSFMPFHSVGNHNEQSEIYIISDNIVNILDGENLEDIASIEIPNTSDVSSVELVDDFLFIGASGGTDNNVRVYDRNTLAFVSQSKYTANLRSIAPYFDSIQNKYICFSYPRLSSQRTYIVDEFDSEGNFSSGSFHSYGSYTASIIRNNENLNYFLKGANGCRYSKESFELESDKLNSTNSLRDYQINSDGQYIYTIQNDKKIRKYSTSGFDLIETKITNENGINIFIDGNKLLLIDYEQVFVQGESRDICVSFYEF